nr:DUF664 domain-containing protein [uncultured Serinicoccus sp.]
MGGHPLRGRRGRDDAGAQGARPGRGPGDLADPGGGDLDATHPLPQAPWFEEGASWSVRRVALHMLAEIAQHAGHADIIREAIDGQRTMG